MAVAPPFSPYLIAGLLMPPGSGRVLERAFQHVASAMWREHPAVGERLADLVPVRFRIEPAELRYAIVLSVDAAGPAVQVVARDAAVDVDAVVRGGVADLLALLDGSVDGDALFFSRALTVEGATEAVVALRNALDGAGVDPLADATARLGPLAAPVRAGLSRGMRLSRRIADDAAVVVDAIRAPLQRRIEAQGYRFDEVEERLDRVERTQRRRHVS